MVLDTTPLLLWDIDAMKHFRSDAKFILTNQVHFVAYLTEVSKTRFTERYKHVIFAQLAILVFPDLDTRSRFGFRAADEMPRLFASASKEDL